MKPQRIWQMAMGLAWLLCGQFGQAQSYNYTLSWTQAASHLYEVSLKTAPLTGAASDFQVPAWRPGRYYVQDYAAGISGFSAWDSKGQALTWSKTDNNTWRVANPSAGDIEIRYQFYANTMDAGSSVLNMSQAYFNPVNFFMHLRNAYERPCTLTVASMPATWKSATALGKVEGQHNVFVAPDYHEFVDCPTVLSPTLKTLHSRIDETDFYFHFQGEFKNSKDIEDAVQSNMGKIIAEEKAIFGQFPMKEYHFIYQLVPFNIGHAVEHKNSSCFALPNTVGQSVQAVARLNGISAHEFFHLWNVKRIRPAAMWPYDYQKEAFTELQWFTEGVTDYYTSLCLTRAGLYERLTYYTILARTIQSLESNYASQMTSPSQSSFDSWLERSDYFPPYAHISYYTLGTRVGLLLDLKMRAESAGKLCLDDVFKKLYTDYFLQNKGLEESAVQKAVEAVMGKSYAQFFNDHVHGTAPIDYKSFLEPFGLELEEKVADGLTWELVGIEKMNTVDKDLLIESVRPGTDAAKAGLGDKVRITKIDNKAIEEFDAWSFFEKFKKAKSLKLDLMYEGISSSTTLTWTGSYSPKTLSIVENPKATEAQKSLREAWLKSKR